MKYHAIEEGQSFARLKEVLADRVRHGVEVRVLYDDIGSIGFLDSKFIKRMEALTVMFLEMWNAMEEVDTDYTKYLPKDHFQPSLEGFIQRYADSPLDDIPMGENVYINLINGAKKSLYVMTPYLIISDEMIRALTLAAQSGVDMRIITPGIPDKKLIYKIIRSYYAELVRGGVRVYEYTSGFVRAKQVICDGEVATVGTINFDYRSLYHHIENDAFLYGFDAVKDIVQDFTDIFADSTEVTEDCQEGGRNAALRVAQCFMRLFAPLL